MQGYDVPPARVFQENMSTIALATTGANSSYRTRNVSTRYLKERLVSGDSEIVYKPTTGMVADILIEPLENVYSPYCSYESKLR